MVNIVNVGYDSANYYVVEQNGSRLLVDVGMPGTLPRLLASLKRKGFALGDLGCVCATHYHPDHAGIVPDLKNKGIKHVVLEQQLAGAAQLNAAMKSKSGYVNLRLDDSIRLTEATSRAWLAGFGLQGEIVSTPGHSDDSISLVLDEGIAFTGDLTPASMVDAGQTQVAQRSWGLLHSLNVRTIYPGHGASRPIPAVSA